MPYAGGGGGGGGKMVKSCANSITSSACFQPSCPAVQTSVVRDNVPSPAMRAKSVLEYGPLVLPFSAICHTCSTGGGGGVAAWGACADDA